MRLPHLLTCLAFGLACATSVAQTPARSQLPDPAVPAEAQAALFTLFQEELARLQPGIPFAKLVLLNTSEPTYRSYAAAGLLGVGNDAFSHLESGLAAVGVYGGQVNGQPMPVCYVLYQPEEAGHIYRNFVQPIAAVADQRSAAAFLMAHEVGHCLDRFERHDQLGKKMVWAAADLAPLGLEPNAVTRVFGATMASGAYEARTKDLYRDNGQRQYEERVADVFGMAWVWRLGGKETVRDALVQTRSHTDPWDAHATAPALTALDHYKDPLSQTNSVGEVWVLARKVQLQVGVDPSLGPNSQHALNPMAQYLDAPAQPDPATLPRPLPQPTGRNFKDLPRFGGD